MVEKTKSKIFEDDYLDEDEEEEEEEFYTENAASNDFEKFFRSYKVNKKLYYMDKITELATKEDKTILVRHYDLEGKLFEYIFKDRYVEMNLRAMTEAVRSIYNELFPDTQLSEINQVHARLSIDDPHLLIRPRNINIETKQRIIAFNCIIVSQTENKPVLKQKIWTCKNCDAHYTMKRTMCSSDYCIKNFKKAKSVHFSIFDSKFTDYQTFEVQERQNDNSATVTPKQLTVKVYGNLVEKFKSGDHVQIVGLPKLEKLVTDAVLNKAENDSEFSNDIMFDLVIEAHHIQLISSTGNEVIEDPTKLLTAEDIKLIKDTKKKLNYKQIQEKLRSCFAYWVHGNAEVKDTIIWQSVGSVPVFLGKDEKKRAEINFLMVGDPGVVKTVLLKAAMNIHTKSMFTSGKGSSGVGLTASLDTTQKGLNKLRVGAVVLADGGICGCDEFLLISEDSQDHLLQCMENGVININKQGINVVLNARTAILGACNPETGKYNPRRTLAENVPLSAPIWSRWDCVTVIRDIGNVERDNKLADHIISQYEPDKHNLKRPLDDDFLFKWLIYARTNNTEGISFTPGAKKKIKQWYAQLRKSANEFDVTATPRQLEAIMRFSIAACRTYLEDEVNEEMVDIVIENLTHHYVSAGLLSIETGGLVQTAQYSMPLNKLTKANAFYEVMMMLTGGNTRDVDKYEVEVELIRKAGWPIHEANTHIQKAIDKGEVIETRSGFIKLPSS